MEAGGVRILGVLTVVEGSVISESSFEDFFAGAVLGRTGPPFSSAEDGSTSITTMRPLKVKADLAGIAVDVLPGTAAAGRDDGWAADGRCIALEASLSS